MRLEDYRSYYWMKSDLIDFARELGLPTHGYKPELSIRIERRLRGLPDQAESTPKKSKERDSDRPLRRETPVVNYYSDAKTRAFFRAQIGPEFHFTYYLNQYRLARTGLEYGDLIDAAAAWKKVKAGRGKHRYRA